MFIVSSCQITHQLMLRNIIVKFVKNCSAVLSINIKINTEQFTLNGFNLHLTSNAIPNHYIFNRTLIVAMLPVQKLKYHWNQYQQVKFWYGDNPSVNAALRENRKANVHANIKGHCNQHDSTESSRRWSQVLHLLRHLTVLDITQD